MIRIKPVIGESDIEALQHGGLPEGSSRIGGESVDALQMEALPIALALCVATNALLFLKTSLNQAPVIHLPAFACGFTLGFPLMIVHEWLHAIVYPKDADVLIGKLKGASRLSHWPSIP